MADQRHGQIMSALEQSEVSQLKKNADLIGTLQGKPYLHTRVIARHGHGNVYVSYTERLITRSHTHARSHAYARCVNMIRM
jgi:hypothetical protein